MSSYQFFKFAHQLWDRVLIFDMVDLIGRACYHQSRIYIYLLFEFITLRQKHH